MKLALAITLILPLMTAPPANARGSMNSNEWSVLSPQKLRQLPPEVSAAIRSAQKSCGDGEPRIRTGFMRYLQGSNGIEFISLHFDRFYCSRPSALCGQAGCLHRIFVSSGGLGSREVWRAQVHEIDMDHRGGRAAVNVTCGDLCSSTQLWNGKNFAR